MTETERAGDFVVTQVRPGTGIVTAEMSAHTRLALRSFLRDTLDEATLGPGI